MSCYKTVEELEPIVVDSLTMAEPVPMVVDLTHTDNDTPQHLLEMEDDDKDLPETAEPDANFTIDAVSENINCYSV